MPSPKAARQLVPSPSSSTTTWWQLNDHVVATRRPRHWCSLSPIMCSWSCHRVVVHLPLSLAVVHLCLSLTTPSFIPLHFLTTRSSICFVSFSHHAVVSPRPASVSFSHHAVVCSLTTRSSICFCLSPFRGTVSHHVALFSPSYSSPSASMGTIKGLITGWES